jgi:cellulose 1,4-beta-cellobiosidase
MKTAMLSSLFFAVAAQQAGKLKENYHMPIDIQACSASGCSNEAKTLTIDGNWRWTHSESGSNCYTGDEWDQSLCASPAECAKNCALGGIPSDEWEGTLGVHKTTDGVKLDFVTDGPYSKNVGSRMFVLESESKYKLFKMLNKEISFDIDVSELPCGLNGAIYFVEMEETGDAGVNNAAGAAYGTGYCDGQCPRDIKFVKGTANIENWQISTSDPYHNSGYGNTGICCAEMDLWEANSQATAFTPHPDAKDGQTTCEGDAGCGSQQGDRTKVDTDRSGCDINAFRAGNPDFYGPGKVLDTTKPFTFVTAFHTDDGTDSGDLVEIKQWYVQDGKRIDQPDAKVPGLSGNSQTDEYCQAQKKAFGDDDDFTRKGGLKRMGAALERGMVLTISLWDDIAVKMNWLDSIGDESLPEDAPGNRRGPCDVNAGDPATLRAQHPHASYSLENLKVGEIGTTNPQFPDPSPPTPTPPAPPTPTPPSPPAGCPGGSLSACISECPTQPSDVYKTCVSVCIDRCSSAMFQV